MAINRIYTPTVTDAIVEKIQTMIADGVYKPGEALLPERQLVKELKVSRASLRAALSALEATGLIYSRQGGGHYVCDVTKNSFADPLLSLVNKNKDFKFQVIELRQSLEGTAAFYAAKRATDQDKKTIQARLDELKMIAGKSSPKQEAKADLGLHLAIADAAHNTPLSLLIRNVYALLVELIEEHLNLIQHNEKINVQLQIQHAKLVDAILAGDAVAARDLSYDHLSYVRDSFDQSDSMLKRNQNSLMRAHLFGE
ncbi:MAG: GntR family transcriptional repressor for pyruvate dehydrogenase complex [Pseudohongiellaceae bacterium]|jgi:GntR family transcriptional repressor for pyruvate dehydrogenase complex